MSDPAPSARRPNLADLAAQKRARELIGTVISRRYKIVELLAMGGVGAVYLGEHVHMRKHVALKILHPDSAGLGDLVARFEREAVAGAHISHPNVAAATDFGELDDGSFFLVLEYVRGTTLREVIKRGPLPAARAARIGKQIAAALGATHAMNIVHRDVKPRNVMLIEGERDLVKLIDFGLAKLDLKQISAVAAGHPSQPDSRITGTGAVFGTIAYLAPEASLGMDLVDARADLYALGLVIYEMLAGKQPFDSTDPVELFRLHHRVKPPPLIERAPGQVVPPPLEAVVMKLLEKDPAARYASAEEVIAALDAALDVSSPTPPPVQLEDTPIYAGPSILPPAPMKAESTPLPAARVSSPAPALVAPAPAEPEPAPPRKRAIWPYAAVLGTLAVAGIVALAWPSAEAPAEHAPAASASAAVTATAAPTAAPSASAAATTAPSAPEPAARPSGPFDAVAARTMLRRAAGGRDWAHATEAFFALAEHDPASFHDLLVATAARDLAAASAVAGGPDADRVFDALAHKTGSDGLDVLYELVRTRGGSKSAARAEELLRKPEVIAQATPALRITFAFREAPCPEKAALLDRAVAEGDGRTLVVLQTVGAACLGRDKALGVAIKALKAKVFAH